MAPELVLAFELRVAVGPALEVCPVAGGLRRIVPILGGAVTGPRLTGTVLPGGADWQVVGADGLTSLVARYCIRADDGALLTIVNTGLRHGPAAVMARLLAGGAADPAEYYFRATPVFEAPPGPHGWLNRHVFVGTGERRPDEVRLHVFSVS